VTSTSTMGIGSARREGERCGIAGKVGERSRNRYLTQESQPKTAQRRYFPARACGILASMLDGIRHVRGHRTRNGHGRFLTPPVNLQRSRIPTLIAVTSTLLCARQLLFAGRAGEKDGAFDGRPAARTCRARNHISRTTCRSLHVPRGCLMLWTIAVETTAMFHALTLITAPILLSEAALAIVAEWEIAVGLVHRI
jgi:hypothetical protein